jgi:predicted ATP-grasp superfamily ATP-dependent carboligase
MFWHKFDPSTSVALKAGGRAEAALSSMVGAKGREPNAGALIVGGDHGSLGVARSLGRRGVPVWFLTDDKIIAKFSRYTARTMYWPGPEAPAAIDFLIAIANQHGLKDWVLFPAGDREVKLITQHHAALSHTYRLVTPPWEKTQTAVDKHLMAERAVSLGIGCPKTYHPRTRAEAEGLDCRFPLILKPSMKEGINRLTQAKAWLVADRTELLEKYDAAAALVGTDHIVLQELVPGDGAAQFSYCGVWQDGAAIGSTVVRRTRQYPIQFGTGTFVETVRQDDVEQAATTFLKSIGYSGLAEIEFKYDARDRKFKILDVNPRVWTWNALGERAGVDFPWIQYRLAIGEKVEPVRGSPGAAWLYLSKDLAAGLQEVLAGVTSPAAYLKSLWRSVGFAAFAADDPVPALVDFPLMVWRYLRQRLLGA